MSVRPGRLPGSAALLLVLALLTASCGGGSSPAPGSGSAVTPERGGTLRIVGSSDVDHLSTISAYYSTTDIILRAFTRQLFSYPADSTFAVQARPVPDLATVLPTESNGGITDDGRTYTIHLRTDAMWDSRPPRHVTAADAARAFAMMCNPVSPVGAPGYYESTIVGMKAYCAAFEKVDGTVPAIKAFLGSHHIAGVVVPDDSTLVLHLTQPATDFLNILAMYFASPIPVEYLNYLPDGPEFRRHTLSDGPYRITHYVPNTAIDLGRNPVWTRASDPIRKAWVDSIHVTEGIDQESTQQQIQAGTADMSWDQRMLTADLATLIATRDPNLVLGPPGASYVELQYMVINMRSPNEHGALAKLKVRQALEYAVNKMGIVQISGGPLVTKPLNQAVPVGTVGRKQDYDPYPTPGDRGDPGKARQLLAEAGYPDGLTLKLLYRTIGTNPQVAQTLQESLQRAGIKLQLVASTGADFLAKYLQNPQNGERGVWDLAVPAWIPDWFGNNGRSVIEPLYDGRTYGPNTQDFGGYDSDTTNMYIDRALSARTERAAADAWTQAAMQVMKDAAIVPLNETKYPILHSARMHNCIFSLQSFNCDVTALWLAGAARKGR